MAERNSAQVAFRRSWRTVVACVLAGLVVMGGLHTLRSTQYQAEAEIFIAEQDLNSLVLGVGITSDPQRNLANDLQLASSVGYQQAVAQQVHRPGFDYQSVQQNLSVTNSGLDDILKFTATAGTPAEATNLANIAVGAYSTYRAEVLASPIVSSLSTTPGATVESRRLDLLARLTRNAVIVSRAQTATPQATLSRDLSVGFIAGLVVGLLLMALREAIPRLGPDPEPIAPPAVGDPIRLRRPSS